ncbi:hypothetical protein K440DRAFT_555895 [Wilcoxina mikolae CBS 423.85]|nr:hypothetical protein K440DRAFT_555895 [Wilcoxina mikolae CBS 423.85]
MKVTIDSTNEWTERYLAFSRKKYWELLAHALPTGRPIIQSDNITPHDFYLSVYVPEKTQEVPSSVQHKNLSCELFPFQQRAVHWMLQREGVQLDAQNPGKLVPFANPYDSKLPPTFFSQLDKSGQPCYVSHILGIVSNDLQGLLTASISDWPNNGGILAEEMGLGKTVELIALLCLHRRESDALGGVIRDNYHDRDVKASGATLIITPPSILHQWQSEIATHAPDLKVCTYKGVKKWSKDQDTDRMVAELMQYDVVLTTYNVLSSEIHFAQPLPDRSLRKDKVYKPKRSPLIEISWWRVCLDEAQMVETGVSNAAIVAREIPRVNAWCVTGTPVRKDIDDCFGLLLFLRYEPLCIKDIWRNLARYNHDAFKSVFNHLALRHSKDIVRDEISLPPQNRVVVTVPFSQVEEQNYQDLFTQMCEEVGVDSTGAPKSGFWNPDDVADAMRAWLMRLRQTCLHPEAGERNRKAFGLKSGPLRTVEQVLSVMIDQHMIQMRTNERSLFWSMVKRGQIHEDSKNIEKAMTVWQEVLKLVQASVAECRQSLADEIKKAKESDKESQKDPKGKSKPKDDDVEDEDEKTSSRVAAARSRLKGFLEIEHACYYWLGTGFYQLREKAEAKDGAAEQPENQPKAPNPDKTIEEYKEKESEYYALAKKLRLELMHETRTRALTFISAFNKKKEDQSFAEVPDIDPPEGAGGIECQTILDNIVNLADVLNEQANLFDEWREKLISLLVEKLVDQDDDEELQGNEVEVSVERQEESYAYMTAIRALLADREESLTEIHNLLIEQDQATALQRPSKIHSQLFTQLIANKDRVNPLHGHTLHGHKSMKRLLNELRMLVNDLKQAEEGGSKRAQLERAVAEQEYKKLQKMMAIQTKALSDSFKEVEQFRNASNARMEFYRQIQAVSDTLLPLDIEREYKVKVMTDSGFKKILQQEEILRKKISQARSRNRYLAHLSGRKVEEKPTCLICLDTYEIGIISNCGHSFCKECILIWRKTAHNCPACKSFLRPADFFEVTYSPMDLAMQKENQPEASAQNSEPNSPGGHKIYADVDDRVLTEIKRVNLDGSSYGSKIDMITRHFLWLKRNEPGFKAVIFSQWSDVLEVIKESLRRAGIKFASLEKPDGIDKFRHDPETSCFLLHAKSQSAGLTLVNATHVFLCEPLLNVGLELQACSRIHRIGQKRTTTVWVYVVSGTVEQSVLELATRRRMAFVGQSNDEDMPMPDAVVTERIVAAESNELREGLVKLIEKTPGGGEMVKNEDLWGCLFLSKANANQASAKHELVKRELMAHAAEKRIGEPSGSQ